MSSFWKTIEWITDKMRVVGAVCLVGMMLLTCADVVGRFFRHPIFGSVEIVSLLATLSVVMALPYTHQLRGHIGVEIVVRLFSEKTQLVIEICTGTLSLALFSIVSWRMIAYAHHMQGSGEVTMNLELPTYMFIYACALGFVVFTLIIVQQIRDDLRKLRNQ